MLPWLAERNSAMLCSCHEPLAGLALHRFSTPHHQTIDLRPRAFLRHGHAEAIPESRIPAAQRQARVITRRQQPREQGGDVASNPQGELLEERTREPQLGPGLLREL